jgi:hypothetical protein
MARVPCPYTYASGRRCPGDVIRVERHVSVEWNYDGESDSWSGPHGWDRGTHFHLFCSAVSEHNPPVKLWGNQLPEGLQRSSFPGEDDR